MKRAGVALIVVLGIAASVPVYHYALKDYQRKRVDVYVNVFLPGGDDPSPRELRREYYHATQAAIAVGSGGFAGKGFGSDLRTHVPEPETDFIFTVIAERLGFLGVLILFGLQGLLLLALTDHLYMINHGAVALDVASTEELDHDRIMQMYFGKE